MQATDELLAGAVLRPGAKPYWGFSFLNLSGMVAILATGLACVAWILVRADRGMRDDLLRQTQLVAKAVEVGRVQSLLGTDADLDNAAYRQLKGQFVSVQSSNPECRFLYLLGRRSDSSLFFFVDSEPAGSKDYSPPGQAFDEPTAELLGLFGGWAALVEGPVTDRWGTWVSALVPLVDPDTGTVMAVLGMDVDARNWRWNLAARAALPVGLILILLIVMAAVFVAARRIDSSPKPVMRRLLPWLAGMVALLIAGAGGLLYQQHRQQQADEADADLDDVSGDLRVALDQQAAGLLAAVQPIAAAATVKQALLAGDDGALLAEWRPVFETLNRASHLTHLYFSDTNRVCLLRVHKPEKRGDRIDRFTAREAERTGKAATGLELGPLGTFTLRVVQPVYENARLVGYVELGKEIEDALETLHTRASLQMAAVIRKEQLDRQAWEEGMRLLGRESHWDRLPRSVVTYSSQGRLSDPFARWADQVVEGAGQSGTGRMITCEGKAWRVSALPLQDAAGKEVGELLLLRDLSAARADFARLLALGGSAGGVLLALLVGFIYVLLRRTDAGIRAQQAEMSESEGKYRLLFTAMTSGFAFHAIIRDPAGKPCDYRILLVNPAFEKMTGLKAGEAVGWRVFQLFPKTAGELSERFARVAETGVADMFEHRNLDLGLYLQVSVYRPDEEHLAVFIRDVTARKQAEEELQASEARMRAVTDSAQEAILMMDAEGRVSYWNPAAERIFGYTRAEAFGQDLHALVALPPEREAHRGVYPAFQQTGAGCAVGKTLDLPARRKDGREIMVQLGLSAVQINGAWHAVGVLRDITERKLAEENLVETNRQLAAATARANEMAEQAQAASIAKSEFLANMSHEIRTPMNGVMGMTGLLLDTPLNDEQRRYAEIVRSSGESLLSLINDILDFSKIEANKLDMETLDFDLAGLLDDFAGTLAVQAQEKGLELTCVAEPAIPTLLRGDPGRLRQILNNLTGNAVKFTLFGEVAIRVSLVEESASDVLLRFSVRDTGIGIPSDKLGLLFSKFSQVDASTTRQYGGTGLGLAISKQLAGLMGGETGVSSEAGKGSEFWFTVRLGKQAGAAFSESRPDADLGGVRVLIVDDNATNRTILMNLLHAWGMRPAEVQDGAEALEALTRARDGDDPFQLAVIDMQMPVMDGETLGRRIKADARLADTRMVMLTSLGTRGDARHFQEIGFAAYATKPIRNRELRSVLSQALAKIGAVRPEPAVAKRPAIRDTKGLFEGCKARILLAEDNTINQQVALSILKKMGLRADAVANGAEALRSLETLPYDLVLMDVQMPEMDGLEATRLIRSPHSAVRNHRVPIIAMTAHAMYGDRERFLEAGMTDYVAKPVAPRTLAEVLDKWLPQDQERDAARRRQDEAGGAEKKAAPAAFGFQAAAVIFDKAGMLARLMDDLDLVKEIVAAFLEDMPRQLAALKGALAAGDRRGVERQAHTVKGASANVGGEGLREQAARMEQAAGTGDLAAAQALWPGLETRFSQLKEAMERDGAL